MKEEFFRKPIRLRGYDYSLDGYYYLTICTKDRQPFFGEIRNGIMGLNKLGLIAYDFWKQIPDHFDNVRLDEFIVMPNHVHGVLVIDNDMGNQNSAGGQIHSVGVQNFEPLRNEYQHIIPKSISSIVRAYKSSVTMWCNQNGYSFGWQRLFYDHIIRNQKSLQSIQNYIIHNPWKWKLDRNNLKNVNQNL